MGRSDGNRHEPGYCTSRPHSFQLSVLLNIVYTCQQLPLKVFQSPFFSRVRSRSQLKTWLGIFICDDHKLIRVRPSVQEVAGGGAAAADIIPPGNTQPLPRALQPGKLPSAQPWLPTSWRTLHRHLRESTSAETHLTHSFTIYHCLHATRGTMSGH